jgi:hypothetical protein
MCTAGIDLIKSHDLIKFDHLLIQLAKINITSSSLATESLCQSECTVLNLQVLLASRIGMFDCYVNSISGGVGDGLQMDLLYIHK